MKHIITNTGSDRIRVYYRAEHFKNDQWHFINPGESFVCEPLYISGFGRGRVRFTVEPEEEYKRIFEGVLASS